jgi:hypothetical protein
MSDIQAQARRDSEFDQLLDDLGDPRYNMHDAFRRVYELGQRHGMEAAYEMGKRHGREMDQEERRGANVLPRYPESHSDPNMAELPEVRGSSSVRKVTP